MVKPLISIITCTYNSEEFLSECIRSIQSQDFVDYEHIVIDGHSRDSTLSMIPASLRIYSQTPAGISAAMNEGISHARGEYIYFLHSDDAFYDSHVLSSVANYMTTHSELDWVYGQIQVVEADKTVIGVFPKYKIFQGRHPWLLKYYNYIPHQGTFVKKSIFAKYGEFDTSLSSAMDPDLWLRIGQTTAWDYMPICVANFRVHRGSQSSSIAKRGENMSEYSRVQVRYLSRLELIIARYLQTFLRKWNKTLR